MNDGRRQMPEPAVAESAAGSAVEPAAGSAVEPEAADGSGNDAGATLPVMPGFREMALRRSAGAQAVRMAGERGRLVRELAEQRQAAGLSQTEIAARMGTSQSAVARLESGTADVRASTLERYAAAVGSEITWKLNRPGEPG
ncbi:MAG TPA: helix-turn-helix transcriptional regulator [Streptosporangiaceae bacterium]|nr:helix-turn-helix transcriptional regulator [Streptosporangiaceae bacterium]